MERATNLELIKQARGHVLVGGLGLGMVVFALLAKRPKIHSLTVLEINVDVINLVTPWLRPWADPRMSVICADVYTWVKRKRDPKFNTIYMDIWPSVGGNYGSEVDQLREHYQPMLSPKGWMGDWQTEYHKYNSAMRNSNRRVT
jgi:spermidine synthase